MSPANCQEKVKEADLCVCVCGGEGGGWEFRLPLCKTPSLTWPKFSMPFSVVTGLANVLATTQYFKLMPRVHGN